jgi:drug/metabolite transporter (DMT)-like permease
MFVGEFLCIILYFIMRRRDPDAFRMRLLDAKSKGKKIDMNPLLLAIPAFCDCLTSTMQYIALNFISGSVYQMLRGTQPFQLRRCHRIDGHPE